MHTGNQDDNIPVQTLPICRSFHGIITPNKMQVFLQVKL